MLELSWNVPSTGVFQSVKCGGGKLHKLCSNVPSAGVLLGIKCSS